MAASRSDSYFLGTYGNFQNRVGESLLATCLAIASESTTTSQHSARLTLVHAILQPGALPAYSSIFSQAVATDTSVLADATAFGTVVLNGTNINTQQALVTDAHMDSAVSAMFNAFSPIQS